MPSRLDYKSRRLFVAKTTSGTNPVSLLPHPLTAYHTNSIVCIPAPALAPAGNCATRVRLQKALLAVGVFRCCRVTWYLFICMFLVLKLHAAAPLDATPNPPSVHYSTEPSRLRMHQTWQLRAAGHAPETAANVSPGCFSLRSTMASRLGPVS